jgi:hypothetical protein
MRQRLLALACLLAFGMLTSPAPAADRATAACLHAMADRLPKLPDLHVVRVDLAPWAPGVARTAPMGQHRQAIGGRIVTSLGGVESSYAVACSVLTDRYGAVRIDPEQSSLRPIP